MIAHGLRHVAPLRTAGTRSFPRTHPLAAILVLAALLRLVAFAMPSVTHPDEVFQYMEPAHRLLFGQGIVTWEWRYGMRGWLIPLLVAGPMAAGAAISPSGALYLALPKLAALLVSLVLVTSAWGLGERLSRRHAIVAALVAATWYEFLWFAPHVTSETLSIACIVPAALLLVAPETWTPRRLAAAGMLLAVAATLRFQQLPAIATLLLCLCGRRRESWAPLAVGGLAGLLPSIAADLAMGVTPFGWLIENVRLNFVANRAAGYGTSGPLGLLPEFWPRWSLWGIGIVLLAARGARHYPALAWTAIANVAFHSAIAHKEYRFVLLSVVLALLLAAIGSVDLVAATERREGAEAGGRRLRFVIAVWMIASLSIALGGFRSQWTKFAPAISLSSQLRADPGLCGLLLYRYDFSMTGGYSWLHRDVPMLWVSDEERSDPRRALASAMPGANVVMTDAVHARELPPAYARGECADGGALCLYRRSGGCDPAATHAQSMNAVLTRIDS